MFSEVRRPEYEETVLKDGEDTDLWLYGVKQQNRPEIQSPVTFPVRLGKDEIGRKQEDGSLS